MTCVNASIDEIRVSGTLCNGDAWDALQVGCEFDVGESGVGEEHVDGGLLAVADFKRDETAGDESGEGLRDEAAVDIEAVVAGEESQRWLVVADFDGKGIAVGGGDVGWIGDDEVEAALRRRGRADRLARKRMRSAILLRSAFSRANSRADAEMSVAVTIGIRQLRASATAIAPEPVPTSRMRMARGGGPCFPILPAKKAGRMGHPSVLRERGHFSTRCSVSGRGISTSGVTRKGRP